MIRSVLFCAVLMVSLAACSDKHEQAPPKTGAAATAPAAREIF